MTIGYRMAFRSSTAAASLVIGALTAATGLANAEPAAPQNVSYSAKLVDKTVVTTLKGGTFELSHTPGADPAGTVNVVNVKDERGGVLLTLPLEFHLAGVDVPVKPEIQRNNTVLVLTPEKPAGLDANQQITVKPIASANEDTRALNFFSTQFGLATTIGTFVGTALGATIGCLATIAAGCLPGFMAGATIGGILGSIAVGGPTLIAAGIDLLTTLQAPAGTSKWADKPVAAPETTAPQAQNTAPQAQPAAQPN
ncbi:hypothetical protein AB0L82_01800 [Nocardia sp. NPDC052001]|uniref:hypothetical protein n=1 Tax=Nocardia sp. NPDC052001 TaxID=3154853 RepID=UPI00344733D5